MRNLKIFLLCLLLTLLVGAPAVRAETLSLEAVAYSPEECGDGAKVPHTANGTDLRPGVMAVDPGVIPFGTILDVPGYGLAQAEDTGGAIIGTIIDLAVGNRDEAYAWGRRPVEALLLRRGWDQWLLPVLAPLLEKAIAGYKEGADPALNRVATRAEFAALLARILGIQPKASVASFRDVPPTHWAAPTLAALREKEIFKGNSDGTFRPDDPVNWESLEVILSRFGIEDFHQIYLHREALTRGELLIQMRPLLPPSTATP
jgi:3D (Asp-Asp-Asp) domain-containing protein